MSRARDLADIADKDISGTVTADALTVTGDLTVDTNTLHVDATNNRVGIGTVTPDSNLKIKSTGAATLRIDGGAVAPSVGPLIVGEHNDADAFYIGTNSVVLGESSNQDVVIYGADSSSGNIRFYAGASTETARIRDGGGITFNGDTAAANALDDYEEGTFTPATTVGTISVGDAAYTKVGRKVTVHFNAYNFSNRSATNHIEFTNMPFTSDSSIGSTANSGMHRYVNAGHSLAFYMPRNQSKIQLFSLNSGSGWTPTQYSHLNSTSAEMYVHLTYFTAS